LIISAPRVFRDLCALFFKIVLKLPKMFEPAVVDVLFFRFQKPGFSVPKSGSFWSYGSRERDVCLPGDDRVRFAGRAGL
jgi:hypothetical protein